LLITSLSICSRFLPLVTFPFILPSITSRKSESCLRMCPIHLEQNNTPNKTSGINNAVSCYKKAVQFSACSVMLLFASFWRNLFNGNEFCIFFRVTLTNIVNTPLDRSVMTVYALLTARNAAALASNKSGQKFGRSWTWPDFRKIAKFWICQSRSWPWMQHRTTSICFVAEQVDLVWLVSTALLSCSNASQTQVSAARRPTHQGVPVIPSEIYNSWQIHVNIQLILENAPRENKPRPSWILLIGIFRAKSTFVGLPNSVKNEDILNDGCSGRFSVQLFWPWTLTMTSQNLNVTFGAYAEYPCQISWNLDFCFVINHFRRHTTTLQYNCKTSHGPTNRSVV